MLVDRPRNEGEGTLAAAAALDDLAEEVPAVTLGQLAGAECTLGGLALSVITSGRPPATAAWPSAAPHAATEQGDEALIR